MFDIGPYLEMGVGGGGVCVFFWGNGYGLGSKGFTDG